MASSNMAMAHRSGKEKRRRLETMESEPLSLSDFTEYPGKEIVLLAEDVGELSRVESRLEEEKLEPRLNYSSIHAECLSMNSEIGISVFTACEKVLVVGTSAGSIFVLDIQGNLILDFSHVHKSCVTGISVDLSEEVIASCGHDRSILIHTVFTKNVERVDYRPKSDILCVSLDPFYAQNQGSQSNKRMLVGCANGDLVLVSRNWIGWHSELIHSNEGPVEVVSWHNSLLAWSTSKGVKVLDIHSRQKLALIQRPPQCQCCRPHLLWHKADTLILAWHSTVKFCRVLFKPASDPPAATAMEIVRVFDVEPGVIPSPGQETCHSIRGVAPFGSSSLMLLLGSERVGKLHPTAVFVSSNGEVLHQEAVPSSLLLFPEGSQPLEGVLFLGHSGGWNPGLTPGSAPVLPDAAILSLEAPDAMYYIVSGREVLLAQPRGMQSHIEWLIANGQTEAAAESLAATPLSLSLDQYIKLSDTLLTSVCSHGRWDRAAEMCGLLLTAQSADRQAAMASAWERWVAQFASSGHMPLLLPHIPTSGPRLTPLAYQMALEALLPSAAHHQEILSAVQQWPRQVFPVASLIQAVVERLQHSADSLPVLDQVLAELLLINSQPMDCLRLCLTMASQQERPASPELFPSRLLDFVEEHVEESLEDIESRLVPFTSLNPARTIPFLVEESSRPQFSAENVVSQLDAAMAGAEGSRLTSLRLTLHMYLSALFLKDSNAAGKFHARQVALYAEFEPQLLLQFLQTSQHYSLEQALAECSSRGLVEEQVFVLTRMGKSQEALSLIVNTLQDMEKAIELVKSLKDEALWRYLIDQAVGNEYLIGSLLDHSVGHVDPQEVIGKLLPGVPIPGLRQHLVTIVTDYRTEMSLRTGCNAILKADHSELLAQWYCQACQGRRMDIWCGPSSAAATDSSAVSKVDSGHPRLQGDRCSLCLGLLCQKAEEIVLFFCSHIYHAACLVENALESRQHIATGSKPLVEHTCVICSSATVNHQEVEFS